MTATNPGHPLNLGIGWTARDVPEIRREMLEWIDSESGWSWLRFTSDEKNRIWIVSKTHVVRLWLQYVSPMELAEPMLVPEDVVEQMAPAAYLWYARHHLKGMFGRTSTSYFVTPEMMALAVATAEALPDNWKLEPEDLPSPSGCMIFGDYDPYQTEMDPATLEQIGPQKYAAVTWTPDILDATQPADPSVFVEWWINQDDIRWTREAREMQWPKLISDMESHLSFGKEIDVHRKTIKHLRLLYTIWQLMQQRQVGVAHEQPDRAERKRSWRADIPDPAVRLIHLRRMSGPPSGEHRNVEWSKRWIVSAHWRQQKYPRTGEIRPKLIMPYVKGPADKPLDSRPVVKVWSR